MTTKKEKGHLHNVEMTLKMEPAIGFEPMTS